jgi:hypothetical protein
MSLNTSVTYVSTCTVPALPLYSNSTPVKNLDSAQTKSTTATYLPNTFPSLICATVAFVWGLLRFGAGTLSDDVQNCGIDSDGCAGTPLASRATARSVSIACGAYEVFAKYQSYLSYFHGVAELRL